jgi:hypothetical protein
MKYFLLLATALFSVTTSNSKTCEEIIELVQQEDYGATYTSYHSSFISKVSFH